MNRGILRYPLPIPAPIPKEGANMAELRLIRILFGDRGAVEGCISGKTLNEIGAICHVLSKSQSGIRTTTALIVALQGCSMLSKKLL